jgi:hypothetical protein
MRLRPASPSFVLALCAPLALACSSTTTPSQTANAASTSTGSASTTSSVAGAGGAKGSGGASAAGGAGAATGVFDGGWGAGGGCAAAADVSPFGDPAGACAACMQAHCGALIAVCFGPGWATGHYAGSCEAFQSCVCRCDADGGTATSCFGACSSRITPDCQQCTPLLAKCQATSCASDCAAGADAGDGG